MLDPYRVVKQQTHALSFWNRGGTRTRAHSLPLTENKQLACYVLQKSFFFKCEEVWRGECEFDITTISVLFEKNVTDFFRLSVVGLKYWMKYRPLWNNTIQMKSLGKLTLFQEETGLIGFWSEFYCSHVRDPFGMVNLTTLWIRSNTSGNKYTGSLVSFVKTKT